MRAIRYKTIWRLHLSNAEMAIIQEAVSHLQADWSSEAEIAHLPRKERNAFKKSFSAISWPEHIEDRHK